MRSSNSRFRSRSSMKRSTPMAVKAEPCSCKASNSSTSFADSCRAGQRCAPTRRADPRFAVFEQALKDALAVADRNAVHSWQQLVEGQGTQFAHAQADALAQACTVALCGLRPWPSRICRTVWRFSLVMREIFLIPAALFHQLRDFARQTARLCRDRHAKIVAAPAGGG